MGDWHTALVPQKLRDALRRAETGQAQALKLHRDGIIDDWQVEQAIAYRNGLDFAIRLIEREAQPTVALLDTTLRGALERIATMGEPEGGAEYADYYDACRMIAQEALDAAAKGGAGDE